jgi:F-type H+-transporting ATPase subunit b
VIVSPSFAQTEPAPDQAGEPHDAETPAAELHEGSEAAAHGGEHGSFPPFDPSTFGAQLFWLVILFGALYLIMSRVALPKVGAILEERDKRIAGDLADAARMKEESDAAIAAHEQALAEARQNGHAIAQKARDAAKDEIAADRSRIEAELGGKLSAAEAEIAGVTQRALADVDAIARDAVEAMVEALVGASVGKVEVAKAVEAAMAEGA